MILPWLMLPLTERQIQPYLQLNLNDSEYRHIIHFHHLGKDI